MDDTGALQGLGKGADLLDQVASDEMRVVGQGLGADGDGLQHERGMYCGPRP
jgi:hypothetical protein